MKTAKSDALLDGGKEGGKSQKETHKEGDQHKPRVAIASSHRLKVEVVTKGALAILIAFSYSDMKKNALRDTEKAFFLLRILIRNGCRVADPDPHGSALMREKLVPDLESGPSVFRD